MSKDLTAYTGADLGAPAVKGSFRAAGNGFDISAGGRDIWESADEGYFVFQSQEGDFDLACRIEALDAADLYTKAGIMARESTGTGSRFVYFQVFPDNRARNKNNGGFEFQFREQTDTDCRAIYPEEPGKFPIRFPDVWIRLQRKGDVFTASLGNDGQRWSEYTHFRLDLAPKLLLGFAVTSHNVNQPVLASFRDVRS